MPATPATKATKKVKKSGCEMKSANVWSSRLKSSGEHARPRSEQPRRHVASRSPTGKPTASARSERLREPAVALDQRDAEPGERAELRADDHRADDQDRLV